MEVLIFEAAHHGIAFFRSKRCLAPLSEMNTKFGSYLQSTTYISLFCTPSKVKFSVLVCLIPELIWVSRKIWFRCLKKKPLQHLPIIRTNYRSLTLFKTQKSGLTIVFCFVLFKSKWAFNSSIKSSITSHQTIKLDFFMIIYPVISWVQLPSTLASISVLK